MPFIRCGDLTTHYQLEGPPGAPVVLFANSLGTNLHVWDAQAAALAGRWRVLRYDMRGHGLTDVPPAATYAVPQLADDALALLDALGIRQVTVCGLSIGGMVAQRMAAVAPARIAAAILCDTANKLGPASNWNDRIALVQAKGMAGVVDGVMARWFTPGFLDRDPPALQGMRTMLLRTAPEGYCAAAAAVRDADLVADDARIRCPTLVIVGDQDAATPPALAEIVRDAIAGAEFAVIKDASHIPCIEQPEALNALITGFLSRTAGGDLYEAGMAVRRTVLGEAHVERATRNITDFDREFQRQITRTAWGEIWTRPGLPRHTRSLLCIGLMAALGHHEELALHIRATRNTGVTPDEAKEVLMQVAVYAGVPAGNSAVRVAKATYKEMAEEESKR